VTLTKLFVALDVAEVAELFESLNIALSPTSIVVTTTLFKGLLLEQSIL
jgi:hypothetical protein